MSADLEIDKLTATVADYPDVVELRLRLIRLLADRGRHADALARAAEGLRIAPDNAEIRAEVNRLAAALGSPAAGSPPAEPPQAVETPSEDGGFDWDRAESEVTDIVGPQYVGDPAPEPARPAPRTATRMSDVAGMDGVKAAIEMSFIGPLRNPELARAYGTGAGGGLLLYGPPGCGKTFLASAIAGELGARFYPVGVPDIVDMVSGTTEAALQDLFTTARDTAPAVIFFDEIDAIGQKRSQLRGANVLRQLVTRLLTELENPSNDGVFVIGATNHPWDLDPALRRPGRFDRMLFVSPPDEPARAALIRAHLAGRPIEGIDLDAMVATTAGFSGADVALLCRAAAQRAMADAVAAGEPRCITMDDVRKVLKTLSPSTGPWFSMARNVVEFSNSDGAFDELAAYLQKRRRG